MSTGNLISLIAMGLIFVIWAACMFQMLWVVRRDAEDRIASENSGLFRATQHRLHATGAFFVAPGHQRLRRRLYLLTALLFAIIITRPMISVQLQ